MSKISKNTLTIGWCDNGMVDGRFTDGLLSVSLNALAKGIKINNQIRVNGNQIGRQRQELFNFWADNLDTDWLLWVDSDIVLTSEAFDLVWNAADKNKRPVVSGTYFVSVQNELSLMQPWPALFNDTEFQNQISYVHPLPDNQIIEVDLAGFGFVLMHRSIVKPIRSVSPDYSLFAEIEKSGSDYVSEDIVFFRKLKRAGIKLHAHTGAVVQHMKRFSLDKNYYNLYYNGEQKGLFSKK
jgi:GT2 family glycosyltransferase